MLDIGSYPKVLTSLKNTGQQLFSSSADGNFVLFANFETHELAVYSKTPALADKKTDQTDMGLPFVCRLDLKAFHKRGPKPPAKKPQPGEEPEQEEPYDPQEVVNWGKIAFSPDKTKFYSQLWNQEVRCIPIKNPDPAKPFTVAHTDNNSTGFCFFKDFVAFLHEEKLNVAKVAAGVFKDIKTVPMPEDKTIDNPLECRWLYPIENSSEALVLLNNDKCFTYDFVTAKLTELCEFKGSPPNNAIVQHKPNSKFYYIASESSVLKIDVTKKKVVYQYKLGQLPDGSNDYLLDFKVSDAGVHVISERQLYFFKFGKLEPSIGVLPMSDPNEYLNAQFAADPNYVIYQYEPDHYKTVDSCDRRLRAR